MENTFANTRLQCKCIILFLLPNLLPLTKCMYKWQALGFIYKTIELMDVIPFQWYFKRSYPELNGRNQISFFAQKDVIADQLNSNCS